MSHEALSGHTCKSSFLLMKWTEQHQLRARGQAGFRRDRMEWIAARKLQIAMEKRTFDRKAVCVLRFSTTYIHKPWRKGKERKGGPSFHSH